MYAVCLVSSILVVLSSIPVVAQVELPEEHLELAEGMSTSLDEDGEVVVSIVVRNTHPTLHISSVTARVAAMQDGLVVGYLYFSCGRLGPGEAVTCYDETRLTKEEYGDFAFGHITLGGQFRPLDESMIIGEPIVIEKSLNCLPDRDGNILFLGEVLNDTNAILNIWGIKFHLYDNKDRYLGEAKDKLSSWFFSFEIVKPQDTFIFAVTNQDIPFAKVDHWTAEVIYSVEKIYYEDIATAVEQATWGEIKALGR